MVTNTKPKRVVTKIGDVFCVEFPDNTKGVANEIWWSKIEIPPCTF